jgi:hypothetical protein
METILRGLGVDLNSKEWQAAIKQFNSKFSDTKERFKYICGYLCTFSKEDVSSILVTDTKGAIIGMETGFLVICPAISNLPLTEYLPLKNIRVVEAESHLFKTSIRVKTNEEIWVFTADKKTANEIDKLIDRVRHSK